jgi:predicted RNase H-like HicB family nuclease
MLWREDGEWYGQGIEEPGAMADGRTIAQCVRNVRDAMAAVVASNIEHGEPVVTPIIDQEGHSSKAG